MKNVFKQGIPAVALMLTLGLMGCDDTARGVVQDTKETGAVVAEGAETAGEAVVTGAQKTGEAINEGAEKVAEGAKDLGERAEDGTRVKSAFAANDKLSAFQIDVDTMPNGEGVILNGSVKTAQEKTLAERVAKDTLEPGKKIQNNLTVAP